MDEDIYGLDYGIKNLCSKDLHIYENGEYDSYQNVILGRYLCDELKKTYTSDFKYTPENLFDMARDLAISKSFGELKSSYIRDDFLNMFTYKNMWMFNHIDVSCYLKRLFYESILCTSFDLDKYRKYVFRSFLINEMLNVNYSFDNFNKMGDYDISFLPQFLELNDCKFVYDSIWEVVCNNVARDYIDHYCSERFIVVFMRYFCPAICKSEFVAIFKALYIDPNYPPELSSTEIKDIEEEAKNVKVGTIEKITYSNVFFSNNITIIDIDDDCDGNKSMKCENKMIKTNPFNFNFCGIEEIPHRVDRGDFKSFGRIFNVCYEHKQSPTKPVITLSTLHKQMLNEFMQCKNELFVSILRVKEELFYLDKIIMNNIKYNIDSIFQTLEYILMYNDVRKKYVVNVEMEYTNMIILFPTNYLFSDGLKSAFSSMLSCLTSLRFCYRNANKTTVNKKNDKFDCQCLCDTNLPIVIERIVSTNHKLSFDVSVRFLNSYLEFSPDFNLITSILSLCDFRLDFESYEKKLSRSLTSSMKFSKDLDEVLLDDYILTPLSLLDPYIAHCIIMFAVDDLMVFSDNEYLVSEKGIPYEVKLEILTSVIEQNTI